MILACNNEFWKSVRETFKGETGQTNVYQQIFEPTEGEFTGDNELTLYAKPLAMGPLKHQWLPMIQRKVNEAAGCEITVIVEPYEARSAEPIDDPFQEVAQSIRAQDIVECMHQINITGNVVPDNWYRWIKYDNGKPHLIAVTLLSEIVYFYRPQIIKDELTGQTIELRKRFAGHKLQRSYRQFNAKFGITKKQARDGIDKLISVGAITKEVKDKIVLDDGRILSNVMYLEIVPDMIRRMTFDEPPSILTCAQ